jgi:hypothetical protein
MDEGSTIRDAREYIAAQKLERALAARVNRARTTEEQREHMAVLERLKVKLAEYIQLDGADLRRQHEVSALKAETAILKNTRKLSALGSVAADAAYGPMIFEVQPTKRQKASDSQQQQAS